jgi:hypothetical protein
VTYAEEEIPVTTSASDCCECCCCCYSGATLSHGSHLSLLSGSCCRLSVVNAAAADRNRIAAARALLLPHLSPSLAASAADIQPGQGLYFETLEGTYRARNCDSNAYGVANRTYGLTPAPCRVRRPWLPSLIPPWYTCWYRIPRDTSIREALSTMPLCLDPL